MAKFDWDGTKFVLREKINIKANDMKKIQAAIDENADLSINYRRYFPLSYFLMQKLYNEFIMNALCDNVFFFSFPCLVQ